MSDFNDLNRQQLLDAAERFGLRVDNRWNTNTLAGKLIEMGVTVDHIRSADEVLGVTESDESAPSDLSVDSPASEESDGEAQSNGEKRVVLKMDRSNRSYSIMGHKFTAEHPFVVMDEEEALTICDLVDGFRIAHPTEAAKFYKGR